LVGAEIKILEGREQMQFWWEALQFVELEIQQLERREMSHLGREARQQVVVEV
jgi:hypothetical protein